MDKAHYLNNEENHGLLWFSQLNAIRLLVVLAISVGYMSTLSLGQEYPEWGSHWGYDTSWFGLQVLFAISGLLAMRSLSAGRAGLGYLKRRAMRTYPLVILYTAIVVGILYPLLCAPEVRSWGELPKLAKYFFQTASLYRPGQVLPGLMDHAIYQCILQGAIWSLRWGTVFHVGVVILWALGLLQRRYSLPLLAALSVLSYLGLTFYHVKINADVFGSILPGVKLGYAFLIGMCLYSYRSKLPTTWPVKLIALASLATLATVFSLTMSQADGHWVPGADLFGSLFWIYAAYLALQARFNPLANWPNLVLGTYIGVWPVAQPFLHIYPDISVAALVITSCICALGLAVIFRGLGRRLFPAQGLPKNGANLSRKIAINTA